MKIAFNVSPLNNVNSTRGTGSYTNSFLLALKKLTERNYQIIEFVKKVPKNANIVHYPFFDPFFLTLPLLKNKPTVVTVHDLIPLKFPDKFPRGVKGEIKWRIQKISLKNCQAIITDSQNSKKDVNEIIGISIDKILVIPLAAAEVFKPITDQLKLNKIKSQFRLPEKYLLYVGDVNWNKNIEGLLTAFARVKNQGNKESRNQGIKLVLVGKAFLDISLAEVQKINNLADNLKITQQIVKLGYVSNFDLAAIYNLASVYIQPSFYEGFGLPLLEAMACGCPVLCSNKSSLPEVGGDAVLYFNPENIKEMVGTLKSILDEPGLRINLSEEGLRQASKFSWKKTAVETLKIYDKVSNNN